MTLSNTDGEDGIIAIARLLVEHAEEAGPEQKLKQAQSADRGAPDTTPTTMNLTLF